MPIFGSKDAPTEGVKGGLPPGPPRNLSEAETNEQIRRCVQRLMAPAPPGDPAADEAEQNLKDIASRVGYYVTAAKMRVAFDALTSNRNAPASGSYKRIYRIVADLLRRHIDVELAGVIEGHTPMGPNLFGSYCSDLIENAISGRGIVGAVHDAISLTETLMRHIIDSPGLRVIFVPFAETLVRASRDQIEAASGRRTPVPRKRDASESDIDVKAQLMASWDAARYMGQYANEVLLVCNGIAAFPATAIPYASDVVDGADRGRADAYVGYLLALVELANRSGHLTLSAMAHQRAGRILWNFSVDRGRESFHTAAAAYETVGDREASFRLTGTAALRYQRAAEIFTRLDASADAARVREKWTALAGESAPRQS